MTEMDITKVFVDAFLRRSIDDAWQEFVEAITGLGYPLCAYGPVNRVIIFDGDKQTVLSNYPPEWIEDYQANEYHKVDPVFRIAPTAIKPFVWSEIPDLNEAERVFMAASVEKGLKDGISFPLQGPFGSVFILSLAIVEGRVGDYSRVNNLIAGFHRGCMPLIAGELQRDAVQATLDHEQIALLRGLANGLTTSQIADQQEVAQSAISRKLQIIKKALGANTSEQAIHKATLYGLLAEVAPSVGTGGK